MAYPLPLKKKFTAGDMDLLYFEQDGAVSFSVIPAGSAKEIPGHVKTANDTVAARAFSSTLHLQLNTLGAESLAQARIDGDVSYAYIQGSSMRNSQRTIFRFVSQKVVGKEIQTLLSDGEGHEILHVLTRHPGSRYFEVHTEFTNRSKKTVTLNMLESFNLSQLSLFRPDQGTDCYKIHRYRSFWSGEGRECIEKPEELGLEVSWARFNPRAIRFGQGSTAPVREFFPSLALEDTKAGVTWAVQLAAVGPWQLEIGRTYDFFYISGGCPDEEFGGWSRQVKPGETYIGMTAILTCVKGTAQDAMSRLTDRAYQQKLAPSKEDKGFPLMFNEFCTTWAQPYPEAVFPELARAKELGVKFFTMDDGWFDHLGNWATIKPGKYPKGFGDMVETIRRAGFIPGLWFEPEHCYAESDVVKKHPEILLTRNGKPIQNVQRFILDMRKKAAWKYLDNTMVKTIRKYGIGYIKIDYNTAFMQADKTCGSDADAAQDYTKAMFEYVRHLKVLFPDLVIEICASGGHRATSEWVRLGDQASVTDAHETLAIPYIAANMLQQVPMSTSQLWATLRADDSKERLSYTLCSGFLGRLCFSGHLSRLNTQQFAIVKEAAQAYDWVRPFIAVGDNKIQRGGDSASYDDPKGWQAVTRTLPGKPEGAGMTVVHFFGNAPKSLAIPMKAGKKIVHLFNPTGAKVSLAKGVLTISGIHAFSALALWTK